MKTPARSGRFVLIMLAWLTVVAARPARAANPLGWPEASATARPWAFWWWMGSAVNEADLTRELERYAKAGMGGVHIIPIYPVKGNEAGNIEYLSPKWMTMMGHAVGEARRLGMDCDMTLGTGWCFGGPTVTAEEANAAVVLRTFVVKAGEGIDAKLDAKKLQALMAFSEGGEKVDLLGKLGAEGRVDWVAPAGNWKVYAVSQKFSGQKVKRASPGGAGPMLNPFYRKAIEDYLPRFEQAFAAYKGPLPRAVYQDSYEYNSNWSPDLFAEFEKRRGYRLQDHLPGLFDDATSNDEMARVKGDYRRTISDLMVENFMPVWVDWAHQRGMITRDQAHGSPGNLLDLYAAADVPETEMFSKDRNPLVAKFASSAAHVTGKKLVSAETGTWLAEHFNVTLGEMKRLEDEMFVSGVNHIFYHGTCYSPDSAAWPGWCFYASTEMNPRNAFWRDVPALNAYATRCQSILQEGTIDNDVLLYWPIDDLWHSLNGLMMPLTVHHIDWLNAQGVGRDAKWLWEKGYGFDYVSDRQLQKAKGTAGGIELGGAKYRVILVPPTTHLRVATMEKLTELVRGGATVVFEKSVPDDVPGLGKVEERRAKLRELTGVLEFNPGVKLRTINLGGGRFRVGDLEAALRDVGRETLADHAGVRFIRRTWQGGVHYFIANLGNEEIDEAVTLARPAKSVVLMDPMTGRTGVLESTPADGGVRVRLKLAAGASVILRTFEKEEARGEKWVYPEADGAAVAIGQKWSVKFIDGGPELPAPFETTKLASWTEQADERTKAFAGTAVYATTFDAPGGATRVMLDLGKVCESARVRLNGREIGTLLLPPWRLELSDVKAQGNALEVEVTNLSANRVRDLDRRGVKWKIFSDINIVNIDYKPFDASKWAVRESGLMGPVTVTPVK